MPVQHRTPGSFIMYQCPPTNAQKRRQPGTPGAASPITASKRARQTLSTPVAIQSLLLHASTTSLSPLPPSLSLESAEAKSTPCQGTSFTTLQGAALAPPLLLSASINPASRLSPSVGPSPKLLPAVDLDTQISLLTIDAPTNLAATSSGNHAALLAMENEAIYQHAQAIRMRATAKRQEASETGSTYRRHVTRYEAWWEMDDARQMREGTRSTSVPAHPITAVKVTLFLEHKMTREKVRCESYLLTSSPLNVLAPFLT